jgi:hypothetical protein
MKRSGSLFSRIVFKLLLSPRLRSQSEGGYIIVVVAGMIVAVSAMLLTAELVARVDSNSTKSSGNSAAGFYAAEAGLNRRAKVIKAKFEGYNVPTGTSPDTTTPSTPPCQSGNVGIGDFACDSSLTVQDYLYPNDTTKRIQVSSYVIDQNTKVNGVTQATSITIGSGELFAGLNAQEYRYDAVSNAYDRANNPTAFLGIRFKSRLVPLFQFAAFYDKDLEIQPSPTMTLSGPVHTNGDLYVVSDGGGSTLLFKGQMSTVGSLYRGRKDNASCGSGTVQALNTAGTAVTMNCGGRTPITDVSSWTGQVRIGVPRVTVPPPEALDPVSTSVYWSKADLRMALKLDSSGNPTGIEVRNSDGSVNNTRSELLTNSCLVSNPTLPSSTSTKLTASVTAGSNNKTLTVASTSGFKKGDVLQFGNNFANNATVASDQNSNTITLKQGLLANQAKDTTVRKAIVSTTDTFYNFREGKNIRMLNVDVQGLMNCANQQSLMDASLSDSTEGGLVWYFTVDGPKSLINVYSGGNVPSDGNNYGIRLYNASKLGAFDPSGNLASGAPEIKGLTVVSDQAIYTQGEYNCGTWNSTTSSCSSKKPAALLADSINVLSNSWTMDDPNNSSTYPSFSTSCNKPVASDTRVNAAFLAGTDTTGQQEGTGGWSTPYNGGLENYPRFHENWSSKTLFYKGSFVSLNKPRRVDGNWGDGCYSPPVRTWDYDTDFNNANNLPPLSPRFVYLRQERFSRDYTRTSFLPQASPFASIFPGNLMPALSSVLKISFRF